ncbi:MAG: hypothetical protein FVQ81_04880 [Candidatus Glassbacteria bacterium]|nr:hypothetical protein [Candidatus Glassbacteria bacterium]
MGLSYNRQVIDDLYQGNRQLVDGTERSRSAQSLQLLMDYGISRRLTLSSTFSLVRQEREVRNSSGADNSLQVDGPGDALVILKYSLAKPGIFSGREVAVGIGSKIPLGESNDRRSGILTAEDMQPGSGAWDWIFWAYASQQLDPAGQYSLMLSVFYRLNGENDRNYHFGDDLSASFGVNRFTLPFYTPASLGLLMSYRHAAAGSRGVTEIPNTGGDWLYITPGANLDLPWDLSLGLSWELPLYRNVKGVQFSTSYSTRISLFRLM